MRSSGLRLARLGLRIRSAVKTGLVPDVGRWLGAIRVATVTPALRLLQGLRARRSEPLPQPPPSSFPPTSVAPGRAQAPDCLLPASPWVRCASISSGSGGGVWPEGSVAWEQAWLSHGSRCRVDSALLHCFEPCCLRDLLRRLPGPLRHPRPQALPAQQSPLPLRVRRRPSSPSNRTACTGAWWRRSLPVSSARATVWWASRCWCPARCVRDRTLSKRWTPHFGMVGVCEGHRRPVVPRSCRLPWRG